MSKESLKYYLNDFHDRLCEMSEHYITDSALKTIQYGREFHEQLTWHYVNGVIATDNDLIKYVCDYIKNHMEKFRTYLEYKDVMLSCIDIIHKVICDRLIVEGGE